jgi:hypothetical protein
VIVSNDVFVDINYPNELVEKQNVHPIFYDLNCNERKIKKSYLNTPKKPNKLTLLNVVVFFIFILIDEKHDFCCSVRAIN